MNTPICLMTGIPRSGTTLCCKLLNSIPNTLALHEPILPNSISAAQPVADIMSSISALKQSLVLGRPFEHGDNGGLHIDNPIGEIKKDGIRLVTARRGKIALSETVDDDVHLFVKQNAMFTALLPALLTHYSVLAIVRNPVDVILSWLTVDLPVNRGRIPGGERFDSILKEQLNGINNRIDRQWAIYQWFLKQYLQRTEAHLTIIRYEDIIASNGMVLQKCPFVASASRLEEKRLCTPERHFSEENYAEILSIKSKLLAADYGHLYSTEEIASAYAKHGL
ncbi:sulfotransferase domain-containing protein [Alteromonas sp. 5E99-2]|uniref:sulfotransferase domain-containing protein n=1 Tax=Alteromonas sp. 5E99-2 TaxID=2817683 RepID=UPI001A9A21B6|nr:sulfotransferase domain-containing protein [Alteromonas sp. 5E99-2]MBO1254135.1 sulfotransferase domain-containing protein [Alteromonas sp. 5E99-2]